MAKGVTRMITQDQIDQIARLGMRYFGNTIAVTTWLTENFGIPYKVPQDRDAGRDLIRQLGTAKRAREAIVALKRMRARWARMTMSAPDRRK